MTSKSLSLSHLSKLSGTLHLPVHCWKWPQSLSVSLAYHSKLNGTVRCYWFTVQVDIKSVSLSLTHLSKLSGTGHCYLFTVRCDPKVCFSLSLTHLSKVSGIGHCYLFIVRDDLKVCFSLSFSLTCLNSVAQDTVTCSLSEVTSKSGSLCSRWGKSERLTGTGTALLTDRWLRNLPPPPNHDSNHHLLWSQSFYNTITLWLKSSPLC